MGFSLTGTLRILRAGGHPGKLQSAPWRRSRMAQFEILLISLVRVLIEVAGLALLGQGLLALLAGKHRHNNVVYKLFQIVTAPAVRLARAITPRFVIDAHIPMLTFFLLLWLWIGLAALRQYVCAINGLDCGH